MLIGEVLFFPGSQANIPRKKQKSNDEPSAIGPVVRFAKKSGFSRDTIRFYEKIGLIKLEDDLRDRYQFKNYPEGVLKRLLAIRKMKEYGFTLQETQGLFLLFEEGILDPVRGTRYVERKIRRIEQQINELTAVKEKLQKIVDLPSGEVCPIDKVLHAMSC